MIVMKFGGTSVEDAKAIERTAAIVKGRLSQKPVVVVSAMAKVTDQLLAMGRAAGTGDRKTALKLSRALRERHYNAAGELLGTALFTQFHSDLGVDFDALDELLRGIAAVGELTPRTTDHVAAFGELLSSKIITAAFSARGMDSTLIDSRECIVTDSTHTRATPLFEESNKRLDSKLAPLLAADRVPVMGGFIGSTKAGITTTIGRGGSDFSASILSAALGARELWIWTAVDGIMTADPPLVPDAAVLHEVTYREAAELAYNGAKVLHPRTLAPLVESRIPVWSKNSFAPEKPGTKIVPRISGPNGARAVTSMPRVALISLEPAHATLPGAQVMARALDALARADVEVLSLSSSSYRQSFCFLVRSEELEKTMEALESALSLELAHGYLRPIEVNREVGLLAIVGEGMQGTPGLAGRIFTAISRERINIIAIAQGSSELTIAIVVRRDGLEAAVRAVHAECGMGTRAKARSGRNGKAKGETKPRARVTRIRS